MSTALYRRYRPETFSDVIGQEHVTEPLMTAISKNRVNHAYLFSGPRGCGKTTSARILARCLNCAQGPTPVPCGTCDSCVELARNGSGSLDVIEIDAASHGGVDDARDLRERATFAPVRDRFKIFIIDEAHMVTSAGFNALLKIVEEPPEHIKFIFATTEPDKVIGTIRSRTHHYPFRLVPPEPLMAYLELLCNQENIPVAPGVLSLVVRAGGGSVRDSLSVLDQLMAGAGASGLDYELAVSLLGYTHASLLDDVVDAIAAGDSATVFGAVDRVIQTGHDPRRFVEDLLERFRDLIIVNAVPDAAASILRGIPDDQLNRMRTQSQQLGRAELSRAADITNTALTEMTGATSPRLHLELLCARILLPAADQSEQGTLARVDRIERRLSYASGLPEAGGSAGAGTAGSLPAPSAVPAGPASAAKPEPAPAAVLQPAASNTSEETPTAVSASRDAGQQPPETQQEAPDSAATPAPAEKLERASEPAQEPGAADWGGGWGLPSDAPNTEERPSTATREPHAPASPATQPSQEQAAQSPSQSAQASGQIEMIRRAWPEIMDELARIKRSTWLNVNADAKPRSFSDNQLILAFASQGNALGFQRGQHTDNLKQAINKVLGLSCSIEAIHDGSAAAGEPDPKVLTSRDQPAEAQEPRVVSPAVTAVAPAVTPVPSATPVPAGEAKSAMVDDAWGLPTAAPASQPSGGTPSVPSTPVAAPAPAVQPTPPDRSPADRATGDPSPADRSPAADSWLAAEPAKDPDDPGPEEPSFEGEPPARPSRYQQLLDEAARAKAARPKQQERPAGAVDLSYVEDIPSADDETIEQSGLVGRQAIERILNGRLIEERSLDQ
ncbi:DNA polymerase III subunit gamma/tau [Arthrobacter sp. Soil782]|uniref:DNA polymerase III subunit gamma and tau n=1 Tax=Arthrobacter sp. Soil782 TaxID=1736410 RepID=UPI0006FD5AD0|nr:DNA polymerase III subunit gamma and tau [Arthrobacter sp. Soil782]KRF09283.1 DNA polymerase III subunit gamma/tau [Arthrobacter sp. Soil782]